MEDSDSGFRKQFKALKARIEERHGRSLTRAEEDTLATKLAAKLRELEEEVSSGLDDSDREDEDASSDDDADRKAADEEEMAAIRAQTRKGFECAMTGKVFRTLPEYQAHIQKQIEGLEKRIEEAVAASKASGQLSFAKRVLELELKQISTHKGWKTPRPGTRGGRSSAPATATATKSPPSRTSHRLPSAEAPAEKKKKREKHT